MNKFICSWSIILWLWLSNLKLSSLVTDEWECKGEINHDTIDRFKKISWFSSSYDIKKIRLFKTKSLTFDDSVLENEPCFLFNFSSGYFSFFSFFFSHFLSSFPLSFSLICFFSLSKINLGIFLFPKPALPFYFPC